MKSRCRFSRMWSAVSSRSPARDACATMRRSNGSCRVSSGKSRIASACSAVMLSSSSPCPVSLLLRSAGTLSLPSMDLIVSSHTVAAETCTPFADVMIPRACGPSRGLSSSSHSRAWLSRSSIAVEHPLDIRVDLERVIGVADLALKAAERHGRRLMGYEIRDRCAGLGDHHALPGCDLLQQPGQMRLRLVDVYGRRHTANVSD